MKKILIASFLLAVLVLPVYFISAADFPKNMDDSGNVVVAGTEELKNLYVGGGVVIVNQKILGDLFSFGSSVSIAGEVEKDLFALGGNINITSPILEDARMAGGNVIINAPIGGDLLVAGGTVSLGQSATVAGDLWVAGGIINITSPVTGDVKISGGEVFINSTIVGTVEVNATDKLTFGPQSIVLGNIVYCGDIEPIVQPGAQVGTMEKKVVEGGAKTKGDAGLMGFLSIFQFIMMFIASLILFKLFRTRVTNFISSSLESMNRFWSNAGLGILAMILIPIVSIILMVSLLGFYLGVTLFVGFVFTLIVACVLSLLTLGKIVENFLQKKNWLTSVTNWQSGAKTPLIGSFIMVLLGAIPFLGGLAIFIVYIATFGNMLKTIRSKFE